VIPAGDEVSEAEKLAALDPKERARRLAEIWSRVGASLETYWPWWARPSQMAPAGDWRTWLVMAGRGFGKTRAGAEWVRALAETNGSARIALVAATMAEARAVMIEGESGILAISPDVLRPVWEPSLGRLRWPSGAQAFVYSAAEPESLRGAQHHAAWADEIAKWPAGEAAWDNLMFGLRNGRLPQAVATTTPRPVPLVRRLLADGETMVTRGRTQDNRPHLATSFLTSVEARYAGTRLGRQELDGELIEEAQGSLWRRELIEASRASGVDGAQMRRIVVGVDPAASAGGDACGIVVVGLGADETGYVLADASVLGRSPDGWAQAVARAAQSWGADRVIAEANQGGAMVESVLRGAQVNLPVKLVHASRGKAARAEPVAALFERGRAKFVGAFPELEDELAGLCNGGRYEGPGRSPDRADAMVWALTELMLGETKAPPRVRAL
jgi:phage terminase large subunit-like protein